MRVSPAFFLLLAIPLLHASNTPGLKMIVRHTFEGTSSDQTLYLQRDRKRTEYRNWSGGSKRLDGSADVRYGPRLASITRCDLGQAFDLNLDTGEYVATPHPPKPLSKKETEALGLRVPEFAASGKPTLRIETTTVDTGERKEFFGHTARHIITTRKQTPLESSKSEAQQMVTDGWYIDLETSISCDRQRPEGKRDHAHALLVAGNMPVEKIEFIDNGAPETGFAIQWKITSVAFRLRDGTKKEQTSFSEMRMTQLVEGPLDSALFAVPTGFRQVERIERNPTPILPSQWSLAWDRFTTSVKRLFN
jgi:hypothetical protein